MKILLVGEYSRLHNTLKEGLQHLGHDVFLIGTGDGFKNYPVDRNYKAKWFTKSWLDLFVKAFYRLTSINLIKVETAFRFHKLLPQLKDFDVVQLINETPINTHTSLELWLLKKLFRSNNKVFLLSCGTDYTSVAYAHTKKFRYSILTPLHENPKLKSHYKFILKYLSEKHQKLHRYIFDHVEGVIASDLDYHIPLTGHPKYLGMIPNPINTVDLKFSPVQIDDKIVIFHGINRSNYIKKGTVFFEEALDIIQKKYSEKVTVISVENIPYKDYINLYNTAHIVLDQVYAYDQGYNALEAMAKGKIVFTGAETEWLEHYNLDENAVAINALPNSQSIADQLESLILKPSQINVIADNARKFIEKEHHYISIAQRYLDVWN